MAYIPSLNKIQYAVETAYHDATADDIEPVGITNVRVTPKVEVEQALKRALRGERRIIFCRKTENLGFNARDTADEAT